MLIVETLTAEGLAAQVGLCVGDHLQAYNSHTLTSPALLQTLSENAAREEINTLLFRRQGEERTLSLPSGSLGMEVRPSLPMDVLFLYQEGRIAWQSERVEAAIRLWREAILQAKDPLVVAWIEMQTAGRYEQKNDLQEALRAYDRAWEVLKTTDERAMQYRCLSDRGKICRIQSDVVAAESCYQLALSLAEELRYPVSRANCLNGLGTIAWNRGDLASSEDYSRRALEVLERLTPELLDVAACLQNLGIVASLQDDLSTAEARLDRCMTIWERLAPDSLDMAASLGNLGNLAFNRGNLAAAERNYRRALAIQERLAPNTLNVSASLNNLGMVALERGDLTSTEDYYRRALAIRERLAPDSLIIAISLQNLGNLASERGDLSSAENCFLRALAIIERFAPDLLDMAASLGSLGNVAYARSDLRTARGLQFARAGDPRTPDSRISGRGNHP